VCWFHALRQEFFPWPMPFGSGFKVFGLWRSLNQPQAVGTDSATRLHYQALREQQLCFTTKGSARLSQVHSRIKFFSIEAIGCGKFPNNSSGQLSSGSPENIELLSAPTAGLSLRSTPALAAMPLRSVCIGPSLLYLLLAWPLRRSSPPFRRAHSDTTPDCKWAVARRLRRFIVPTPAECLFRQCLSDAEAA
jgi:hypothetical protein